MGSRDNIEDSIIGKIDKKDELAKQAIEDKKLEKEVLFYLDQVGVKRAITILRHAMVHVQTKKKWNYGDK